MKLLLNSRPGQTPKSPKISKLWAVLIPVVVMPWTVAMMNPALEANANDDNKIVLSSHFRPDPQRRENKTSGNESLANLSGGKKCRGFAQKNPTYEIELKDDFSRLTFLVEGKTINDDATLLIKGPNNFVACGDDEINLNPYVDRSFAKGKYRIWVGSKKAQTSFDYTLSISEGSQN
ncbi:MAG: hypothetical protein WCO45_09950 [Pseudanabaena sp. ELA607]|jgi:hypothetical protein